MAEAKIGKRIKTARIREGWSQAEFAEKIGATQAAVSSWETGRVAPSTHRTQIEKVLGRLERNGARTEDSAGYSDGPSPIGAWLVRERLQQNLSVTELADMAGVSIPAVYNIESGRTPNPRRRTIQSLEQALGNKLPDDARAEAHEDATIEGVGTLEDFNPHDDDERPTAAGIYVLYDISERPIYVGQGSNIKLRIRDHSDKFWFKSPIVETASYVEITDKDLREKVEGLLIRFLKSNAVINKQHVAR